MLLLKMDRDDAPLNLLDSLAHRCGPKYLIECFQNLTVLNLGNVKSEFLKLSSYCLD